MHPTEERHFCGPKFSKDAKNKIPNAKPAVPTRLLIILIVTASIRRKQIKVNVIGSDICLKRCFYDFEFCNQGSKGEWKLSVISEGMGGGGST